MASGSIASARAAWKPHLSPPALRNIPTRKVRGGKCPRPKQSDGWASRRRLPPPRSTLRAMSRRSSRARNSSSTAGLARGNKSCVNPLFRQRHNVALQPRRFLGQLQMEVDLVQVGTHAQQNAARGGGRQQDLLKTVVGLDQKFHAVGPAQQFSTVESVDVQLIGRALEPAEEM